MKHALTLSIVIPVYNEERHIGACLDSIAAQTVAPFEVIVVDNNSTDKTREIVASYKFVKILDESRQHQVYAQSTGFDAAKGELLGRIDGDSVLPDNWVEKIINEFNKHSGLVAVTGVADPYDVPLKRIGIAVFEFYQMRLTRFFTGKTMLWNSSSAFRAKCWPIIKRQMKFADNLWEDHEMSYWLSNLGEVKLLKNLKVGCSFRSIHKGFFTQLAYQYRSVRVFSRHNSRFKTVLFFFAWYSMTPIFILAVFDRLLLKITSNSVNRN
ncbi:MAG: glycosyltransferase family 2 protein [Candidatus Saccharimonadales bacterium]